MKLDPKHVAAYIQKHGFANAVRHFSSVAFTEGTAAGKRALKSTLKRPRSARPLQRLSALLLAFTLLSLVSCSTQVVSRLDGTRIVNNNLLSRGHLTVSTDGSVSASGNSEAAATELGKYGGKLIGADIAKTGISAANSAVSTITKAATN